MQITNVSSGIAVINDMPGGQSGQGLTLQPGAVATIFDQDADKSAQLGSLINAGIITITGTEEPSTGEPEADQSALTVGAGAAPVKVSGVAAAGKVVVASSATAAAWAVPPAGTGIGGVTVSGTAAAGSFIEASSASAAAWTPLASHFLFLDSVAGAGGSATPTAVVTGLLTTDVILGVSQRVAGANSLPLLGFSGQAANALNLAYSADPGAGNIVRVAIFRA